MTRCTRDLEWLLEAEPSVLRGESMSADAAHVADCPRCGAMAAHILEGTRRLDAALGSRDALPDVEGLVARARLTAEDGDDTGHASGPASPRWPWPPARSWWTLAAAAALAGILLLGERDSTLPGAEYTPRVAQLPLVEETDNQSVAVIATDNPDITVLWFFSQ